MSAIGPDIKTTVTGVKPQSRRYMHALDMARNRAICASIIFVFLLVGIAVRMVHLSAFQDENEILSVHDAVRSNYVTGRGNVVDRNGIVLATSVTTSSLYGNARKIKNPVQTAKKLTQVLPRVNQQDLIKKLSSQKTFVWLVRHLTPRQQKAVMHLGIPGISLMKDVKRVYPHGNTVAHVVGHTNIDHAGIAGIEKTYDQFLRTSGDSLYLSIDIRLQHAVRDELYRGLKEFKARGASAVVMDYQTSEVVAMVSLPDFNPNQSIDTQALSYFNKATSGMYEMGSTMKIINTAMVLDSGAAKIHTTFDTSEPIKIGKFQITDYRNANHGVINVAKIFVHSSNKGSARMALAAGTEAQQKFMQKIGFLRENTIELPEYGRPIFPTHWREANTITISYGYGLAISPLNLLNGVASVTGDGCKKQATLIKGQALTRGCERIVDPKVAKQLRQLMRFVVTDGTSRKAFVPGYYIGAKTGTRNLLENGRYNKDRVATSFVGIIGENVDQPRYIVVVMLEDPKGLEKTFGLTAAWWNAAPIGGRIMARLAPMIGLKPNPRALEQGYDAFFLNASFK